MNLVLMPEYNIYKLEPITEIGEQKIPDILKCFIKEKEYILFMLPVRNINYYSLEVKEYIRKKIKIISNEWILPWKRFGEGEPLAWFAFEEIEEIDEFSHKIGNRLFISVIVKDPGKLRDYSYLLQYKEEVKFIINEDKPNDFMEGVLPKLKGLIPGLNCRESYEDEEY